ncbi:hypothetical protein CL644_00800 [bacterium]|nr:hypothetical protein [bacterium]|tara:strand:+ start:457 stop:1434 length:978 start_codon:yes stop_codon:yes gene_type:complete
MSKKIFLIPILSLFLMTGTVSAQVNSLPSAGLTPESTFYFLDRFGENLREFFTFNSKAKAKLQIKFAGERISEISVMVEKKGTEAKGIEKAKTLLLGNVAYAAEIIQEEKTIGKDVSKLAKEIDDAFDEQEKLLVQTFQDARKKLKDDRLALKRDLTGVSDLEIETQIQLLDDEVDDLRDIQDDLEDLFDDEQDKIEDELDDDDRAEDEKEEIEEDREDAEENIEEAQEKKEEVIIEAQKEGVSLPAGALRDFNNILAQAKSMFVTGNYKEAERLANQAEDSLEELEDIIEEIHDENEESEELEEQEDLEGEELDEDDEKGSNEE